MSRKIKSIEEGEERLAQLKEKEAALKAQQKAIRNQQQSIRAKAQANERKARNHAAIVAGTMIFEHMPEKDWKQCDFEALAQYLRHWHKQIKEVCSAPALPLKEANERLKNWEREAR